MRIERNVLYDLFKQVV